MPVVGSVFGKPLDDDVYGIQNALAIIVSGDTAPSALSQGKYIYLINHSTIRSGLYKIISAIASGDAIVSTDIEAATDGIINDLVEADGTKVNKTDIVDNLTTNDPTKVLSAAQGYALNSKFTTLETITLVEGTKVLASGSFGTLATRSFDPGSYLIVCTVSFQDATAGVRIVLIDTTETNNNYVGNSALASGRTCLQYFRPITLTNTTTLYFRAYQNSGGDITASWRYHIIKL